MQHEIFERQLELTSTIRQTKLSCFYLITEDIQKVKTTTERKLEI